MVIPTINGVPVDTISISPFNYNWETQSEVEDSYHVLGGLISDYAENYFYVPPIVVYIDNFQNDISPPAGLITNPVSGQQVTGIVNFTVLAQDDQGINNVEFFINGNSVSIDTDYPFQYAWDTTVEDTGSEHTLSATVSDNANHTIFLQPVLVSIYN